MPSEDCEARAPVDVDFTGLTLVAARSLCGSLPETAPAEIQVLETAPPFLAKGYTPEWGEWRVLRARHREGVLEFTVARELLGEIRAARAGRPA